MNRRWDRTIISLLLKKHILVLCVYCMGSCAGLSKRKKKKSCSLGSICQNLICQHLDEKMISFCQEQMD